VKHAAGPAGVAITTRLLVTPTDEIVLDAVAGHLGQLRRADLARACHPASLAAGTSGNQRQTHRDELNARKRDLTTQSSARWANAIIATNDAQYRRSRDAQERHITNMRAAIKAIQKRLAQPTTDTLSRDEQAIRKKARLQAGYPTQAERFQKQRRLQSLRAELSRVRTNRNAGRVQVTEGGRRLASARRNLSDAGLTVAEWQETWRAARWRIGAIGTGTEPFGNLTITVAPGGEVSIRLPRPLEHLANAKHGRYDFSGKAQFAYRGDEWLARVTGGKPVSYVITRKPGRAGVYLTAEWTAQSGTPGTGPEAQGTAVHAADPMVGVDLNDGHLAVRRLDSHGNPIGRPERIQFSLTGRSSHRDAQVRHAITRLLRYTRRYRISAIAIEDLNFAHAVDRDTMGKGRRCKRFRKTVAGIPTSVFRDRLTAQAHRQRIALHVVNPAYTSVWGDQHWRKPYEHVTRHEAAATVIGRRAQGYKARRREGVTRARPEDLAVRATNQAELNTPAAKTGSRHRPRDTGKQIPRARPGKNAATGPGNRNPGTGQQRSGTLVTVPGGPSGLQDPGT
jgi:hypothetical protein